MTDSSRLSKKAVRVFGQLVTIMAKMSNDTLCYIAEDEIRRPLEISHGTFSAARRELVDAGAIKYESGAGPYSVRYSLTAKGIELRRALAAADDIRDAIENPDIILDSTSPAAAAPPDAVAGGIVEFPSSARVDGSFADFDDWVEQLGEQLGSVSVDLVSDDGESGHAGTYAVTINATEEQQVYEVVEGENGDIEVN